MSFFFKNFLPKISRGPQICSYMCKQRFAPVGKNWSVKFFHYLQTQRLITCLHCSNFLNDSQFAVYRPRRKRLGMGEKTGICGPSAEKSHTFNQNSWRIRVFLLKRQHMRRPWGSFNRGGCTQQCVLLMRYLIPGLPFRLHYKFKTQIFI